MYREYSKNLKSKPHITLFFIKKLTYLWSITKTYQYISGKIYLFPKKIHIKNDTLAAIVM